MATKFQFTETYRATIWVCDSVTTAKETFTSLELTNELNAAGYPHTDKSMRNALARMVRCGDLIKDGPTYTWATWNDWANE